MTETLQDRLPVIGIDRERRQTWIENIGEVIDDEVLIYLERHRGFMPSFQDGGYDLAAEILITVFKQTIESQEEAPWGRKEIRETIKKGLKNRQEWVKQTKGALIKKGASDMRFDLFIPKVVYEKAKVELTFFPRQRDFLTVNSLLNVVNTRQAALDRLAPIVLSNALETDLSEEEVNERMPSLRKKAMLLRGLVVTTLVEDALGEFVSPLFVNVSTIELLEAVAEKLALVDQDEYFQTMAKMLVNSFEIREGDEEIMTTLFHGYLQQTMKMVESWLRSSVRLEDKRSTSRYWKRLMGIFKGLPIEPFSTKEQPLILSASDMEGLVVSERPPLWANGVEMNEVLFPSEDDLRLMLQILRHSLTRIDFDKMENLDQGVRSWQHYTMIKKGHPKRIENGQAKIGKLEELIVPDIKKMSLQEANTAVFSLTGKLAAVKRKLNKYDEWGAYNRVIKEELTDFGALRYSTDISAGIMQACLNVAVKITKGKLLPLSRRVEKQSNRLRTIPSWTLFKDQLNGEPWRDYTQAPAIKAELDLIEEWLVEMKEDRDKFLPDEIMDDRDSIAKFISWWAENNPELGKGFTDRELINLHFRQKEGAMFAEEGNYNWQDFRFWILDDIQQRKTVLTELLDGVEVRDGLIDRQTKTETILTAIEDGATVGKIRQNYRDELSLSGWELILNERRVGYLGRKIERSLSLASSETEFRQAKQVLELFNRCSTYDFKIPKWNELGKIIVKLQKKSESAGAASEMLTLLFEERKNIFLPWYEAEGLSLREFMGGLKLRLQVVEAIKEESTVSKKYSELSMELEEAKDAARSIRVQDELKKTKSLVKSFKRELFKIDEYLVRKMQDLDLVVDKKRFKSG